MKMFNYMLVVFGIFVAGIVNALDKRVPNRVTAGLCFVAAVLAIIFTRLDRRNRDLVWLGEDVLTHLESEEIFGVNVEIEGRSEKKIDFGILRRQALEERGAKARIQGALHDKACASLVVQLRDAWCGKHRVWLPVLGYLMAILFLGAGISILRWGPFPPTFNP